MILGKQTLSWVEDTALTGDIDKDEVYNSGSSPIEDIGNHIWKRFDALTTYGVKLWRPDTRDWVEISIRGKPYEPRNILNVPGKKIKRILGNQLIDGSIIDLCGATLLFQSVSTMSRQRVVCEILYKLRLV
jgi:hypothetical protein